MPSYTKQMIRIFVFYFCLMTHMRATMSHPAIPADKTDNVLTDLDLVEDNSNLDNAILNYLFAKDFVNRMRRQMDTRGGFPGKRSYWKQCAFNAVSCFG